MRRPFVAGNWKMNLTLSAARELVGGIRAGLPACGKAAVDVEIAVCPPSVYLFPMAKALDGSGIGLGAQDAFFETAGAFTGEISCAMITETGARYLIIGHSERRHTIGHLEDDWMINRKLKAAIRSGLCPILCVGETLGQRDAGATLDVLTFQLAAALAGQRIDSAGQLVVAYEPVWAIGTGRNATPEQAQEAHAHIRADLGRLLGPVAAQIRILYGGSVKPDNAAGIFCQADVDGGLIGGASLKAEPFLGIIRAAG